MRIMVGLILIFTLMGCSQSGTGAGSGATANAAANGVMAFSVAPNNMLFSLTDSPLDGAQSVNVNVQSVEVWVEKDGQQGRIILAQNVGMIDLLQLRNNVFQTLGVLSLPPGATINMVRMILGDGNNVVETDGSICPMSTPSAQESGVKLLFTPALVVQPGYSYAVGLDFDVEDSVVVQGNGNCLLKPVIKVKDVEAAQIPPVTEPPGSGSSGAGSGTGSGVETWNPSTTTTVSTSGSSDGTFTDTSTSSDPAIVTATEVWTW